MPYTSASIGRKSWLKRLPLAGSLSLFLGTLLAQLAFLAAIGVFFKPLPYQDPGQLYVLNVSFEGTPIQGLPLGAGLQLQRVAGEERSLLFGLSEVTVQTPVSPQQLVAAQVVGDPTGLLGAELAMGDPETAWNPPAGSRTLVLSWRTWQEFFKADPRVVGRPVKVNEQLYHVAGILNRQFQFPAHRQPDILIPLSSRPMPAPGQAQFLVTGIFRLESASAAEAFSSQAREVLASSPMLPPALRERMRVEI